jgi:hypothetical protein
MTLLLRKLQIRYNLSFLSLLLFLFTTGVQSGVGESAVITLIFPPGSRSTGMGEAFTGLANDATATYFNPAGLGQAPQANSWKAHLTNSGTVFTAVASKKEKSFTEKDIIWVGTDKGIMRFNGTAWTAHDVYLIEENDDLESIVKSYLPSDDDALIQNAVWELKKYNGLGMKRFDAVRESVKRLLIQKNPATADSVAYSVARSIVSLESFERSEEKISSIITESIDSLSAAALTKSIDEIFLTVEDKHFDDLTDLKVPFSIAVNERVSSLAIDNADRTWIGTANGVWRFDTDEWTHYSVLDGLPSNNILSVATGQYGEIAAGTDKGLALYEGGQWSVVDTTKGLADNHVTSIAFGEEKTVYVGTLSGMTKITEKATTHFDTADGLISQAVYALLVDSDNRVWIGGDNGVAMYNGAVWKRYKFPESRVSAFTQQTNGIVWIGTNKGVVTYKDGNSNVDKSGNVTENPPEWKSYHSKNALIGNHVGGLSLHDNDVWIATDEAVNQYDNAERQVFLFFEQLLPALMIRELWHAYGAFIWPTQDWGTLGLSINYIHMGKNPITDALGRSQGMVDSWEGVFGLSWALPLKDDFSIGLNAKYVYSALAPGIGDKGDGVGQTFAIDAALLKRNLLIKNLDLGFMMQNMGPTIFYMDRDNRDPIPFTLRLGLAYGAVKTPINDLKFLLDMHKEIVKNNNNGNPDNFMQAIVTDFIGDKEEDWKYEIQEINYNLGMEYWYSGMVALRSGFLLDYIGERYEWTFGLGFKYSKLIIDWSYIVSPEGFLKRPLRSINSTKDGATGVRNGQMRTSLLFNF